MAVSALTVLTFSTVVLAADKPLLQEGKKTLYQRVLTQPGCTLAKQMGQLQGTEQATFSRFYVYERDNSSGSEWLKVGPDSYGNTVGWLPANCVVDWKMQLTLAFTNPANRDPLLFFKDRQSLEDILDTEDPASAVEPLRAALQAKQTADNVLAQEPALFVDIQKEFYLLPILSGEEVMTEEGFRTRVLNVASVTEKDSSNDLSAADTSKQLKEFSAAVVFVIDSTISMQPYIERTRQAVKDIYQRVEAENLGKQVKFGLISFRSSLKDRPGLEYLTKMYVDPNDVQSGDDFLNKIKDLNQAKVRSDSTISMQPYIERTRQAVKDIYQRVEAENLGKQVKFGLISFRSSLKDRPGLEYLTKMYVDPNDVQSGDDFLNKIKDLNQAKV